MSIVEHFVFNLSELTCLSTHVATLSFKTSRMTKEDLIALGQRFSYRSGRVYSVSSNIDAERFVDSHVRSRKPYFLMIRTRRSFSKTVRPQMCANGVHPKEYVDVFICRLSKDKKRLFVLSAPIANEDIQTENVNDRLVRLFSEQNVKRYDAPIQRKFMQKINMRDMIAQSENF